MATTKAEREARSAFRSAYYEFEQAEKKLLELPRPRPKAMVLEVARLRKLSRAARRAWAVAVNEANKRPKRNPTVRATLAKFFVDVEAMDDSNLRERIDALKDALKK